MGVLVPGLRKFDPPLNPTPPINVSGNFSPHVSAVSPSNISPNPSGQKIPSPILFWENLLINFIISGISNQCYFFLKKKPLKITNAK
jgi:hypothetical protein